MSDYRRIQPGEPMYEMVKANKNAGLWVCDSYDHNDSPGCSNPDCFKFKGKVSVNKRRSRVQSQQS